MKIRMFLAAIVTLFGFVSYATVVPTVAWTNNLDTVQNGYSIIIGEGCATSNGVAVVGGSEGVSIDLDANPDSVSVLVKYSNCKPQPTTSIVISAAVRSDTGLYNHELGACSYGGNTNSVTGYWHGGFNYSFGGVTLPESGYILFSASASSGTQMYAGSSIFSLSGGTNTSLKFSRTGVSRITLGATTGTKSDVSYSSWDGLQIEQITIFEAQYLSSADIKDFVVTESVFSATNPVTGETAAYCYKYVGNGAWNADDWIDPENKHPATGPALSGGNIWDPILIDGGQAVTAGPLEGWKLELGLFNGSNLTVPSLYKWQGGCRVSVDKDSKLTISGLGNGSYENDVNFYVAAPEGITYDCDYVGPEYTYNFYHYYHFSGDGSVSYQLLTSGNHIIKEADVTLSGSDTKELKCKLLVSFTSSESTFTADADVVIKYEGKVARRAHISSVKTGDSTLTADNAIGDCELVQTATGIFLYYIDGDPSIEKPYLPSININFTHGQDSSLTTCEDVGLTEYAVPGTCWNNVAGINGTVESIYMIDSSGAIIEVPDASVTISKSRGSYSCISLGHDGELRHGYIDDSQECTSPTITVEGIPFESYRVIIYHSTNTSNIPFGYDTINGINYTYENGELAFGTGTWGASGVSNSANPISEGVNTLVSGRLTRPTLKVVGHRERSYNTSFARGCIAAIQIVEWTFGDDVLPDDVAPDCEIPYALAAWNNGVGIETTSQPISIGTDFSLDLNGNSVAEDGSILICNDKGVLLDWSSSISNMTIMVWCSIPDIKADSALVTISRQGVSEDIIGISVATDAMSSGIWRGENYSNTYDNGTSYSDLSVGENICLAFCCQDLLSFNDRSLDGTALYEVCNGGIQKLYSSTSLKSYGSYDGCALGGTRSSGAFASLSGMAISAIAIYNERLEESQMWRIATIGARTAPGGNMVGDESSFVAATISNIVVQQHYAWDGIVCLDFSIDCEDKDRDLPITIDVFDDSSGDRLSMRTVIFDGVAMDSRALSAKQGVHHIIWNVAVDNPEYNSGKVRVEIEVGDVLGKYMVVDLSPGPEGQTYPIRFLDDAPMGGWTDEYKTTNLVLRLVDAGSYQMGCDSSETGYFGEYEATPHAVELTKPFYMGVFEVTQRQFELITGTNTSVYAGASRPLDSVPLTVIRGDGSDFYGNWPEDNYVAKVSFIGCLRSRTGIGSFDLPTEAEWEYACRAGTSTALNNGKDLSEENLSEVGRYSGNSEWSGNPDGKGGYDEHTVVGMYLPNAWGFYDMHGNVWEWCLDWYQRGSAFSSDAAVDPVGPYTGTMRVVRGGAWRSGARVCRSAHREGRTVDSTYLLGMRIRCSSASIVANNGKGIWTGDIVSDSEACIVSCGESVLVPYSPEWLGADSCSLLVDGDVVLTSSEAGEFAWTADSSGIHELTLVAGDVRMNTRLRVLPTNVVFMHSGEITGSVLWDANKVYVVDGMLNISSNAELTIQPGAVVKFAKGGSIKVAEGGSCIARGAIFTHIADDTVGGDSMDDGEATLPIYDQYSIDDAVVGDANTELRYLNSVVTIGGSLSGDAVWWGRRVYHITSNIDVPAGSKLTVTPGTVLKFATGVRMNVYGGLDVQGARYAPVVFTSIKDDEFCGDTNGDGDATWPEGGDWDGLWIYGGKADLTYARLRYSGSINERGALQAFNSRGLYDNSNNSAVNAEISMNGCEVSHSKFDGIVNVTGGNICVTNTVIFDVNWATGPFSGPKNEYVNCVFYGNNVGLCYWNNGRWRGTPVYRNCIFANCINGWCETALDTYGDPSNPDITISNCLFWNEPGYGSNGCDRVGSNGNVWGDPLFEDAENGDFRIKVNSPCVDAGDGGVAPETDYYGRPRMDNYAASNVGKPNQDGICPDIGIYEVDGRVISPSADLAVLRVDTAHSPTVAPGDTITLTYTITNCGVMAASGTWRDEISLVSPSGRTVVLGENIVPGNIPIGGTLAGTASFTVPAVEEGTWRVRINANAQHDIYEGARTANNVFTSGDGIEVSVVAQSPSEVSGGSLKGGVPHVVKLAFAEGDVNRMVILSLSEGGVASWGFGHVPDAVSKDGTAVTDASGKVSFIVPDGDVAVYIVLESDTITPWSLTAESPKTSVIGIAPSSGAFGVIVRAVVSGGGFTASNLTVRLVSNGGGIATSATYVNDETIILDIDTGLLAAGEAYDVEVIGEMGMAVLEKAFSVEAPAAKGVLSAKLDLPSSARQGRVAVGYVVCANSGNAEMDAPVFVVSGNVGDIALRGCEATNRGWTNSLWLVGISSSYPKGRLKPGDEVRIPFEFMVNGTYHMELVELDAESPLVRDSIFPSWQKFSAAIASSATVLNGISGNICDYGVLYDYAIKSGYGDDCGIVRGVLLDDVSGAPLAQRTVVAIDSEGVVSDRAVTDTSGAFVFSSLVSTNTYIITGAGIESSAVGGVKPENALASEVTLAGHDFATICAVFCENGELVEQDVAVDVVPVLYCENGARWPTDAVFDDGMFRFFGIPDGNYTLVAECGGETFWAAGTNISVSVAYGNVGDGTVVSVPVEKCGRVLFRLEKDGTPATGVVCHAVSIVDGEEVTAGIEAPTGKDGIARFNLKPGSWRFSVSGGYRLVGDGEIDAEVLLESEIAVSGAVTFVPFTAFPDVGPRPLPVSFSADFLPDPDAVASYAWDFDGDGVADSTLAMPSYTYSTSGKKGVSLSVVYTNGTSAIYSDAAAVDVWDEEFVELETSTLLLDAASGYRVASRTEDSLVLEYTREAVPADFSDVVTIVIPGEESSPLAVRSWSEVDDGIIVETTASSPMRAYRSMRMATVTTLGSNGEMMCSYKDVPIGPWTFSTELCTDGQWRKRGTTQSRMGVALAIEWNTGTIHYLQAVDKDEGGKIVFWESRFKGRWEPEATISGQIEADGQKNRRGRGVRGSPYKPLSVNDQLLALVAGVPICYSAGAEFTATTSLGGEIAIRPAFDVDIGYRYAPDRGGNKPYKTFRSLDDARGLAIRGKGELDLYAGLFAEIYAGANKKAGTKEFGLKVCDITVGGGVAAKASFKVSSDEFEPDEYSFGIYGRFKFDFAPVEVNLGLWKFKPLNVGWHPEKEIIKKELKTPVPTLNISHGGRTVSGETIAFENKTNYGKWSCSGSGLDNGDRECVNLPKGKKYSHFYSVSPEDTRKCEVVLREKYSFYVGNHPIINPTKANKYSFTVRGSKDPPPPPTKKKDDGGGSVPKSWDPNEMIGPFGSGEARLVKPGDVLTYTVYFENKADAEAAAQEVRVTNPLSEWLDWSTFEMGEVAFNNQVDLGLGGKSGGVSEATMNGTNFLVRTEVQCDTVRGAVDWYLRIVDPTTETTWPSDILTGFLPPNDDTHRGEGHITYRIKVREDAPYGVAITNSASIVFDFNDPIETDPAWWNTVAPTIGTARFAEQDVVEDEGSNIVVRVKGGNLYTDSSVNLYLTYSTAAAADLDLAKGAIDGVTPKGGLKFPLQLSWEAGDVGERVVTIPVKADKAVEDDEFFSLQLGAPVGMEFGDTTICTVTIHDPGYDDLEAKVKSGTATKAEKSAWDKLQNAKAPPYIRGLAEPADAGKVTGSGLCAEGKKVTLKATANKGFVFMDWRDGAGSPVAMTATLVVDRTAKPAASTATSTTLTGVSEDATYYAKFITVDEDRASITLSLSSMDLDSPSVAPTALETNITCGVALEWQLAAGALSATTVKVAGLPAGLKFEAKSNTIYGAPTAASKVGKDGKPTPSEVKITVTTAGKSSVTYLVKLTVDPLPAWAVGTFDGEVESGGIVQAFTVATSGKIGGKVLEGGRTWTLSAGQFNHVEHVEQVGGGDVFYAAVVGKAGKEVVTNEVEVAGVVVDGVGVGVASSDGWTAWQNLWSRPDTKASQPVFKKNIVVDYLFGAEGDKNNTVKITFKKDGAVSFAGKVEGVSVSGSTQLVWNGEGWQVTLYAPPKGAFEGFSETLAVTLTVDDTNAVTDVAVLAEWQ